ncbi:DUF4281 domain-containing protein [Sphingomonas lacunae]|uniref:DUF4281 domain-containing protein n=1 Tax=Sphingomonas lacunae TaxID=2698828 RepID=A0A6M4B1J7_9SPHN|nr:ABA4-like family protein [Sphingomonas lacunae]QJQ33291.1 DUF4281 domain-containing protein [Sphingomonas lacunae]
MAWETLFSLTNGWAMVGWVILAFLPRKPFLLSFVLYLVVALLCLVYAVALAGLVSGQLDAGGGTPGTMDFTSLAGVMALFDSKGGAVIGWTHYLAFDLFTGLWIARDADAKGFSRIVQVPILFATLMVGPVGLLIWLVVRERRARAMAKDAKAAEAAAAKAAAKAAASA